MSLTFRNSARNLFNVIFERDGNVLFAVLPYCILNCGLLLLDSYVEERYVKLSFSPTGHGLMTLLVSFLVISKVNLTYERFRIARHSVGSALLRLRELNQLVLTMVEANNCSECNDACSDDDTNEEKATKAEAAARKARRREWKADCMDKMIAILDATKDVLQSSELAKSLARHEGPLVDKNALVATTNGGGIVVDPMELVQDLRLCLHVTGANHVANLFERIQLLTKLGEFVSDYRQCIDLASTPLPFSLIQMGRSFLFIWTFSMPLVLREGPFSDIWSALVFLFFLTYGFIGLELVAMQLATPFGDGPNDIRITALCNATVAGMERDLKMVTAAAVASSAPRSISQRRFAFARQKKQQQEVVVGDDSNDSGNVNNEYSMYHGNVNNEYSMYHSMPPHGA